MFKKNNKNNEEVIRMEQTTFIQRHAKKILVAGGLVVGAGAAYLMYKHGLEIKDFRERIEMDGRCIDNLLADNEAKDKEIGFIKFLVVEGDVVPKALQNAENKLSRKENKIKELCELLVNRPNDQNIMDAIAKNEAEAKVLREQIFNTLKLNELIVNDENIYTK
jgi:hypothetical protein